MTWGDFTFSIDTFAHSGLSRSWEANLPEKKRGKSNSQVQTTGKPAEIITIRGAVFPMDSIAKTHNLPKQLRRLGNDMKPKLLTLGSGEALGPWFLNSIQEEQSSLLVNGVPRKQSLTLQFTRYHPKANPVEDESLTTNPKQKSNIN